MHSASLNALRPLLNTLRIPPLLNARRVTRKLILYSPGLRAVPVRYPQPVPILAKRSIRSRSNPLPGLSIFSAPWLLSSESLGLPPLLRVSCVAPAACLLPASMTHALKVRPGSSPPSLNPANPSACQNTLQRSTPPPRLTSCAWRSPFISASARIASTLSEKAAVCIALSHCAEGPPTAGRKPTQASQRPRRDERGRREDQQASTVHPFPYGFRKDEAPRKHAKGGVDSVDARIRVDNYIILYIVIEIQSMPESRAEIRNMVGHDSKQA